MSIPWVSVVLPTYNRAATLPRAIASVLGQSFRDLELIVVDDGSTDATAAVVASIADPRLAYHRCERNGGVSAARNIGMKLARAPWVAFQDSDDKWRVDKLDTQLAALRSRADAVLAVCGDLVVNHYPLSFLGVDSPDQVVDFTDMTVVRLPPCPTWVARRSALLELGGFDEAMDCFEDWELALRLLGRGRVLLVNDALVLRQRTPGSLFSSEARFAPNLRRILERHAELFQQHPAAWASYCNFLGQSECQFGRLAEGRSWFVRALRARPRSVRTWANLVMSFTGAAGFRAYQRVARALRSRIRPPVRPPLYVRPGSGSRVASKIPQP